MNTKEKNLDVRDRPGVWFSLLCDALAKHDFATAAEAKHELERLGVTVKFRQFPNQATEAVHA